MSAALWIVAAFAVITLLFAIGLRTRLPPLDLNPPVDPDWRAHQPPSASRRWWATGLAVGWTGLFVWLLFGDDVGLLPRIIAGIFATRWIIPAFLAWRLERHARRT